jgi:hypothetical protein
LNSRFGFNLNKNTTSPFQIELLRDQANVSLRNSLFYSLKHQLKTIWSELLNLADYKSQNEAPILDSHLWASYQ